MATRNIVNYQGTVIGQLTLPDNTSETNWQNALAPYAQPPKGMSEIVYDKLGYYEQVAEQLIRELKRDNTLAGITLAQSDQLFDDYADVLIRIREGAFPTALYRLQQKQPSGFVTQEILDAWIAKIKAYL